jgi:hypothetical protein
MLDRLEMAIRRYKQIAPNSESEMTQPQADQLVEWLERQVGEVVSSLLARPGFRFRTRWSIERLSGESDCPERATVLAVDDALVQYAQALISFARTDAISSQLLRLGRYQNDVPEGDSSALDPRFGSELQPPTPLGLRNVEFVASRPWRDLASTRDYFRPVSQFNLTEFEFDDAQWIGFLPFWNKQLRVPGDFIVRCMDIRINQWREDLRHFSVRCDTARARTEADLGKQWGQVTGLGSQLDTKIKDLRQLCMLGPEARVRDSCVALLQIHAGFHQNTDLSWLGLVAKMIQNVSDIPYRVFRRREWEIPERAATALIDITDLVRRPQATEDLIEEMKTTKRLVLVEEERTGFLDGKSINKDDFVNWHGQGNLAWELLWTFADRASIKRTVDRHELSNPNATRSQEPPTVQAIKDRRSKLKKLITPELNALIHTDDAHGSYRLVLEPGEICLLGWSEEERLEVLTPTMP